MAANSFEAFNQLYQKEQLRLAELAPDDSPAGEYAHPVFGIGDPSSSFMLIGEAPGAEETKQGVPFVGKAGKQLSELVGKMGLTREAFFVTNTVKYRPVVRSERSVRNRTPGPKEVAAALPLLKEEILLLQPKVILTLGNTPLKAILTLAALPLDTVGNLHGRMHPARIGSFAFSLFPLYHPASGIYNRSLIPVMEADAVAFGEHLVKLG